MTLGEAPASRVLEVRASAAVADALVATCGVARGELDDRGRVSARTWAAIDDLVDALIEALPARQRPSQRPLHDENLPEEVPAELRPDERTREHGR